MFGRKFVKNVFRRGPSTEVKKVLVHAVNPELIITGYVVIFLAVFGLVPLQ